MLEISLFVRLFAEAPMQYRTLGRTGLRISEIGLGGHEYRRKSFVKDGRFTVLDPSRPAVVKKAIDSGINYFDTTFFEETQSLGTALKVNGIKRSQVHLSGMSIDLMKTAGEKSADTLGAFVEREITQRLELLGTDYFDIFQICAIDAGYTPDILDAVLEHLQRYKQKGYMRFLGASAHDPVLLERVIRERDPFDVVMAFFNFNKRPADSFFDIVSKKDIGFIAIKPLVWFDYGVSFVHLCRSVIEKRQPKGVSAAQMALRWILETPEVSSVIPAVNSMEELMDNVTAGDLPFTGVDLEFLDRCRAVPGRMKEMIELIDHPYSEVKEYALAAVKNNLKIDLGSDKGAYLAELEKNEP